MSTKDEKEEEGRTCPHSSDHWEGWKTHQSEDACPPGLRNHWSSEEHQVVVRLYDLPALLLCLRPALPHVVDLRSSASSGSPRRAPDEEVP